MSRHYFKNCLSPFPSPAFGAISQAGAGLALCARGRRAARVRLALLRLSLVARRNPSGSLSQHSPLISV